MPLAPDNISCCITTRAGNRRGRWPERSNERLHAALVTTATPAARCRRRHPQSPGPARPPRITTTQIYDKRRRSTAESASHDVPI